MFRLAAVHSRCAFTKALHSGRILSSLSTSNNATNPQLVHWKTTVDKGQVELKPPLELLSSQPKSDDEKHLVATFVGENTSAKEAHSILSSSTSRNKDIHVLVYEGPKYGRAQQFVATVKRRLLDRFLHGMKKSGGIKSMDQLSVSEQWKWHRRQKQQEAEQLNRVFVQVNADHSLTENSHLGKDNKRSRHGKGSNNAKKIESTSSMPSYIQSILQNANGERTKPYLFPLREIAARVGADQWHQKGVPVDLLNGCGDGKIHPHFNVYPPTRQEYLNLLCAPKDATFLKDKQSIVMDVGCGTGILSAILMHRHPLMQAVLTDISPLAIACAKENMDRLGLLDRVLKFHQTSELFADAEADLLVCNPPWLPATPAMDIDVNSDVGKSWLERAIYDDADSSMLFGFLKGASSHMRRNKRNGSNAEAWLVLSDLAEHLQLRSREELLQAIHDGGMEIVEIKEAVPVVARKTPDTASRKKGNIEANLKEKEHIFPKVEEARQSEMTYLFRMRKQLV